MAFGNLYPQYQYQQFQPQYQQYQQQFPQQIQNGGFISVRSMEEALNWPIAPGNSIMFKDENSPYVYTKTKGFSQLDQPIFEKYRLVKEGDSATPPESPKKADDGSKCEEQIKLLWDEVNAIKRQIEATKPKQKKAVKKEVEADEQISTDAE